MRRNTNKVASGRRVDKQHIPVEQFLYTELSAEGKKKLLHRFDDLSLHAQDAFIDRQDVPSIKALISDVQRLLHAKPKRGDRLCMLYFKAVQKEDKLEVLNNPECKTLQHAANHLPTASVYDVRQRNLFWELFSKVVKNRDDLKKLTLSQLSNIICYADADVWADHVVTVSNQHKIPVVWLMDAFKDKAKKAPLFNKPKTFKKAKHILKWRESQELYAKIMDADGNTDQNLVNQLTEMQAYDLKTYVYLKEISPRFELFVPKKIKNCHKALAQRVKDCIKARKNPVIAVDTPKVSHGIMEYAPPLKKVKPITLTSPAVVPVASEAIVEEAPRAQKTNKHRTRKSVDDAPPMLSRAVDMVAEYDDVDECESEEISYEVCPPTDFVAIEAITLSGDYSTGWSTLSVTEDPADKTHSTDASPDISGDPASHSDVTVTPDNPHFLDIGEDVFTAEKGKLLANYLNQQPKIVELSLTCDEITPEGMEALIDGLTHNTTLLALSVHGAKLEAVQADAINKLVERNQQINDIYKTTHDVVARAIALIDSSTIYTLNVEKIAAGLPGAVKNEAKIITRLEPNARQGAELKKLAHILKVGLPKLNIVCSTPSVSQKTFGQPNSSLLFQHRTPGSGTVSMVDAAKAKRFSSGCA